MGVLFTSVVLRPLFYTVVKVGCMLHSAVLIGKEVLCSRDSPKDICFNLSQ